MTTVTSSLPRLLARKRGVPRDAFDRVKQVGLRLPGVDAGTRYDGCPVLTLHGCFMAAMANRRWAEPGTLMVRSTFADRDLLIADAPATYYVTDYHRPHPVVLVRLATIDEEILRELLQISWQLTKPKTRTPASPR